MDTFYMQKHNLHPKTFFLHVLLTAEHWPCLVVSAVKRTCRKKNLGYKLCFYIQKDIIRHHSQKRVLQVLFKILYGLVCTYHQILKLHKCSDRLIKKMCESVVISPSSLLSRAGFRFSKYDSRSRCCGHLCTVESSICMYYVS